MSAPIQTQQKQHKQNKSAKRTRKDRRNEKEVKLLQERVSTILPRTTFKRIVTQEAAKHSSHPLRFNVGAVNALQAAAEQEITTIFTGAAFIAGIAKRETITCEDMNNFQNLRDMY
jgi:histone H3/H4